ncbi:quinate utilization pathway activator [Phlyctema vagabunda]|uniref:Quinate utilization pathway activator n=1 Tax=Phlyctema vagabunda TaxID=108571 RepID=A0ABR4PTT4_9HELO
MIEVESMQLARLLELHQVSSYEGLNCIETQLRKKGFWLMFYGYVHSQLQNLRKERLTFLDPPILNHLNLEDLMPLEVDDEFISSRLVLPQPVTTLSLTTGFNIASRIFWAALTSVAPRDSPAMNHQHCDCVRSRNPVLQYTHLQGRLHHLKYMLDEGLPTQLRQWSTGSSDEAGESEQSKLARAQSESMRANIHVTHLWLQSILADQIDTIRQSESGRDDAIPAPDVTVLWREREDLCRQLLHVLHSIDGVHLEPNGHHLVCKVRDVAVSLLGCPFDSQGDVSKRATEYLLEFTNILSRLDGSEKMNTLSLQSWVDTDRNAPYGKNRCVQALRRDHGASSSTRHNAIFVTTRPPDPSSGEIG